MSLEGLRIVAFESRRADVLAKMLTEQGGLLWNAPSVQERPLEEQTEALRFGEALLRGEIDMVILTTGVGTSCLLDVLGTRHSIDVLTEAFRATSLVSRGPKPAAALREAKLRADFTAAEPNTWREILDAVNVTDGMRVAVQEYGVPNPELVANLEDRGASVWSVPIYRWELPRDTSPICAAVERMVARQCDIVVLLSSVQLTHLLEIAEKMGERERLLTTLREHLVVASIGPVMSESLRRLTVEPDFEPKHPKLGFFVRQLATEAAELVAKYRR